MTVDGFDTYLERVVVWVAEWRPPRRGKTYSADAAINGNMFTGLGVDGADAVDLLAFLWKKSGVEFFDFPLEDYFGSEGVLDRSIFRAKKTLSIRDLASYMYNKQKQRR